VRRSHWAAAPPWNTVEQRLRSAIDSASSGLLMTDAEGRIVLVNREIERLFDYSREELLGQPVEILVPLRLRHAPSPPSSCSSATTPCPR
jgi:PAS domain-containing protein